MSSKNCNTRNLRSKKKIGDIIRDWQAQCCPICLDDYKNPIVTNCHHTFCKICIQTHIKQHRLQPIILLRERLVFNKHSYCPLCNSILDKTLFLDTRFFLADRSDSKK